MLSYRIYEVRIAKEEHPTASISLMKSLSALYLGR